jgi:hypothetical protein
MMNYSFDENGTESHARSIRRQSNIFFGIVVVANIAVLTWTFWPAQNDEYGVCMERMADKAHGNATIFNRLASSNCYKLSPAYIEQKTKEFDAEIIQDK